MCLIDKSYLVIGYSRSDDDQQKHIAKLAIALKERQDQGQIDEMDALVADTTQHISMYQCLGENRLQFTQRMRSGQPHAGLSLYLQLYVLTLVTTL